MKRDARLTEQSAAATQPADELFRLLVESISDYAICLLDPGGRVTSWNPGAELISGYAAAEVLGRHFSLLYTGEDRAAGKPEQALRAAGEAGRFQVEAWRVRRDGSRFRADVVITALRDAGGRLSGFAKVTRDITREQLAESQIRELADRESELSTQRQRALEQVQASEARLQAFTGHSPAVMFLKDLEGRYRFVNAQFLQRFGLRTEQVLGRTDLELFAREQALAFAANDAQVLARGAPVQVEETSRYVEGERINIVVKFPVLDAAGRIAGVGGVATDITESKQTEQALREQRTLLAEAQKVAGLGSWEWDPASGRLTWSDELYRIYGLEPRGFKPTFERYLERVHPEDRQHVGATVAGALLDGRGFTLEERIVRPDGAVRNLRSHGEVVRDARGGPLKLLGACFDVTEQKSSEAALRAAAASLQALTRRLVEAEEAERRRIASELHDRVGQNLSALNINLDLVLAAIEEAGGPADLRLRLRDSLALVDGTLQSIENVMAELRPPLLDEYGLGAALDWYGELFARRTGIAVDFDDGVRERNRELDPKTGIALFRIAQEALNNVAKHAAAKRVRLAIALEGARLSVSVADDGAGFDPAALRPSRWGMTTMRERAEAAGGTLAVDSSPGTGTRLSVTVPFPA